MRPDIVHRRITGTACLTARYADAVDGGALVAFTVVDDAKAW
jgi:hypothetical protein